MKLTEEDYSLIKETLIGIDKRAFLGMDHKEIAQECCADIASKTCLLLTILDILKEKANVI